MCLCHPDCLEQEKAQKGIIISWKKNKKNKIKNKNKNKNKK